MLQLLRKIMILMREYSIRKTAHAIGLILLAVGLIWLTYSLLEKSNQKDLDEGLIEDAKQKAVLFTSEQSSFDPDMMSANRKRWAGTKNSGEYKVRDFFYSFLFHPALILFFAIIVNIIFIGSIIVYYVTKKHSHT
jgi:hypothetical protein